MRLGGPGSVRQGVLFRACGGAFGLPCSRSRFQHLEWAGHMCVGLMPNNSAVLAPSVLVGAPLGAHPICVGTARR